ncbi:hypothetical protein GCM10027435_29570 [Haloparvum alkalitolerans]
MVVGLAAVAALVALAGTSRLLGLTARRVLIVRVAVRLPRHGSVEDGRRMKWFRIRARSPGPKPLPRAASGCALRSRYRRANAAAASTNRSNAPLAACLCA